MKSGESCRSIAGEDAVVTPAVTTVTTAVFQLCGCWVQKWVPLLVRVRRPAYTPEIEVGSIQNTAVVEDTYATLKSAVLRISFRRGPRFHEGLTARTLWGVAAGLLLATRCASRLHGCNMV